MCVRKSECVCVRKSECVCEKERVCVCEKERVCVCEKERVCVCVRIKSECLSASYKHARARGKMQSECGHMLRKLLLCNIIYTHASVVCVGTVLIIYCVCPLIPRTCSCFAAHHSFRLSW